MDIAAIEHTKKAGVIAKEVVVYSRGYVKKGMPLLEIAQHIEQKIVSLGGKPAFPVNLSINEIAAHATPVYNDTRVAEGLLKVDIGVHIKGYTADTAFTVDLENSEENKNLISAAEAGLQAGVAAAKKGVSVSFIGRAIDAAVQKQGVLPIRNLTGHGIEHYDVHAGITIPNYDSGQQEKLVDGVYAIEPFTTTGVGRVHDGAPSGIYQLIQAINVRDSVAREVLAFIDEEYQTLPFCSRWIYEKFGGRGLISLRIMEQAGILHQYSQLVESGRKNVAQAEHTILIHGTTVEVITG